MVARRFIFLAIALAALVAATAILLPDITTDLEHPAAMTLKGALGLYKDRHGHYPRDLRSIESEIREITRSECRITNPSQDVYDVEIDIQEGKTWQIEILYRLKEDGGLETFHVDIQRA